jgi:hypothetical protein
MKPPSEPWLLRPLNKFLKVSSCGIILSFGSKMCSILLNRPIIRNPKTLKPRL